MPDLANEQTYNQTQTRNCNYCACGIAVAYRQDE